MSKKNRFGKRMLAAGVALTLASSMASGVISASALSWNSDFSSFDEEKAYAAELNIKLMEESITLLKNNNNALPLAKGSNISLFGTRAYNPIVGGTGSGGSGSGSIGFADSLEAAGITVNGALVDYYNNNTFQAQVAAGLSGPSRTYVDGPTEEMEAAVKGRGYTLYNDAAVVVLGRVGGEGADLLTYNIPTHTDKTEHVLELDDNEKTLLAHAKANFDKVIVLINSANTMELGGLQNDPDIDAIVWVGEGGANGLDAVGRVLNGEVSPSGKTVDVWASDLKHDPTWQNFGLNLALNEIDPVTGVIANHEYTASNYAWETVNDDPATTDVNEGDDPSTEAVETSYQRLVPLAPNVVSSSTRQGWSNSLEYEEGIYLGYKYYETAHVERPVIWDYDGDGNADEFDYNEEVTYPYGYGLSYTSFSKKIVTPAAEIEEALNNVATLDSKIEVQVEVTNTGKVAGKEVVQLYVNAPYTGGIERAEVALVSFGKTDLLQPDQSQVVTLQVRAGDVAAFDYNDANGNGFSGWEWDAGNYQMRLQDDSHTLVEAADITLIAKQFKQDGTAATALTEEENYNIFSQGDDYDTMIHNKNGNGGKMTVLSRKDMTTTFPKAAKASEKVYSEYLNALLGSYSYGTNTNVTLNVNGVATRYTIPGKNVAAGTSYSYAEEIYGADKAEEMGHAIKYTAYYNSSDDRPDDPWYKTNEDIPATWTQGAGVVDPTTGEYPITIREMAGIDYWSNEAVPAGSYFYVEGAETQMTQAAAWDTFMNQLTWDEIKGLLSSGSYRTNGLATIGKDQGEDADGPARFDSNGTNWCCEMNIGAAFNTELAYEQGRCVGNESLYQDTPGWYGPAMNVHRSAFSGRNFEYYSQDALHMGIIGAAVVKGAQEMGLNCYIKHFAVNDQETNRQGVCTFVDEQAMRENYLKAFEYAVKEGGAAACMTAYNRVGAINAFGNYQLINGLLRGEWGFKGHCVTDFYRNWLGNANYIQRGGCELPLGSNTITGTWDPTLRDGKGGVRDGNADAEGVVPESATQYVTMRESVMRMLWSTANSNCNTGYRLSNLNYGEIDVLRANASATLELDPSELLEARGINEFEYVSASGVPAGMEFNTSNGRLTGTPTTPGSYTVSVNVLVDGWITATATANVTVAAVMAPNAAVSTPVTIYVDGDSIRSGWYTYTVENATVNVTVTDAEGKAAEGLSVDLETRTLVGSLAVDGTYTVTIANSYDAVRNNNATHYDDVVSYVFVVDSEYEPPVVEEPVHVHGGIVSNEKTSSDGLVDTYTITYEDGCTDTYTVTNGADGEKGETGAQGPQGEKGETGVQGPQGEKGETGAAGKDGVDGEDGADGKDGAQGPQGEKGETGAQGPKGDKGEAGEDALAGVQSMLGCSGSIAGIASLVALAVVGGALAFRKKED